jgi:GntR family transcriptional regulator
MGDWAAMQPRARDAAVTIQGRIADQLRLAITEGTYGPGDALPSTAELVASEGVAALTVRAAYQELIREGLVVAVPRRGYFVREHQNMTWRMNAWQDPQRLGALPVDGWTADIQAAGYQGRQEIKVGIAAADQRAGGRTVGELLQLADGERLLVRWRVRYIRSASAEEPQSLADSYYPYDLVRDSKICDPASTNTAAVLASLGAALSRYVDELTPRIATPQEQQQLQLPPATAVLELVRTGITATGKPVLVQHIIHPGQGSRFVYHVAYPESASQ